MNQIRHVAKPWGYEIWWAQTDSYAGKLLQVEQGHRLSLHYHRRKDQSCYLLSGLIRLVKGPSVDGLTTTELAPGACWRNRPGEIHTIEAIERSVIVQASTPEFDDVVRLLDDYERCGGDGVATESDGPTKLLDKEQVAARLELRRDQISQTLADATFPKPSAYFRGRLLWEEAAVDAWRHRVSDVDVVSAIPVA
jgi:mannose-6-phosphate isomerase